MRPNIQTGSGIHIGIENVYAEIHEMVQVCNCGAPLGTHF